MKLNDAARELIGSGADATLVTLNPDGSPQVTLVSVALQSTRTAMSSSPHTWPNTRRFAMSAVIRGSR